MVRILSSAVGLIRDNLSSSRISTLQNELDLVGTSLDGDGSISEGVLVGGGTNADLEADCVVDRKGNGQNA